MLLRIKALADDYSVSNDKKVVYHFSEPMMAHGCFRSSNVEEQEKLKNKLTPFLEARKMMEWPILNKKEKWF